MNGYQIALLVGLVVFFLLYLDRRSLRKKQHRILTDEECRRWYPTMQAIVKNTRGKHEREPVRVPRRPRELN